MAGRWLQHWVAPILLAGLMVIAAPMQSWAQGTDDLTALREQVSELHSLGKYGEAIQITERYVALARERHGEEHTEFAKAISWLGSIYHAQGRYAEAESPLKRALAIAEKALGPDHPDVGTNLNNLAELYRTQGCYAEAEPLYKRALAIANLTCCTRAAPVQRIPLAQPATLE